MKYKIWNDFNFIIEYFSGQLDVNDIIVFKKRIAEDPDYKPTLNVIEDFRDANLNESVAGIQKYYEFFSGYQKRCGSSWKVHITSKSNENFVATLFESFNGNLPVRPLVCNELSQALKWINVNPVNYESIARQIQLFREETQEID